LSVAATDLLSMFMFADADQEQIAEEMDALEKQVQNTRTATAYDDFVSRFVRLFLVNGAVW
jgi:hypothetical protein